MDEHDIFKKLGFGVKFNTKRFKEDAQKLHIVKTSTISPAKKNYPELNFFANKKDDETALEQNETDKNKTDIAISSRDKTLMLRRKNKIYVDGNDVPEPISSFKDLFNEYSIDKRMIKNLTKRLGFEDLTPIQMQAVTAMLHRREILACAPTGSGKTVAFLLPVVTYCLQNKSSKNGLFKVLILSPTRELAIQTLQVSKQLTAVESSENRSNFLNVKLLDKNLVKRVRTKLSQKLLKCDILITTPNRLVYLLQHDPPLVSLKDVEWLVVDESDKLFEGGDKDTFREQLGVIYRDCTSLNIRRAMFSATFAFDVQQWCQLNMDNVIEITIGGKNTAVKSVKQKLLYTGNEHGKLVALRDLLRKAFKPPVLIFVQSKERAKELFAELVYDGMNVDAIHADRTEVQRNNAVTCFRTGQTWILICTELMGRGVDFRAVNLVINFDFPTSSIAYIHRIGRTGRAGRSGEAITFFTDEDKLLLRSIANVIREAGCDVPEYALKLNKLKKTERKKIEKRERKRPTIRTTPQNTLQKSKKPKIAKPKN